MLNHIRRYILFEFVVTTDDIIPHSSLLQQRLVDLNISASEQMEKASVKSWRHGNGT